MTDIQSLRRNSESLKRGFQTLSEIIANHRQFVILLLVFLINLLLVSPSLMPEIYEINGMHDSGFRTMDFVAYSKNEPICLLSGCSDVIHIDGIGGFGHNCLHDA